MHHVAWRLLRLAISDLRSHISYLIYHISYHATAQVCTYTCAMLSQPRFLSSREKKLMRVGVRQKLGTTGLHHGIMLLPPNWVNWLMLGWLVRCNE